jgi:hypothetical protein
VIARLAKFNKASVANQIDIICTDGHVDPQPRFAQASTADAQGSQFSTPRTDKAFVAPSPDSYESSQRYSRP